MADRSPPAGPESGGEGAGAGAGPGEPGGAVKLVAEAFTPRTRVVVFSHVTSSLGIKLPAAELCGLARERGALAIVDGAQAVGQLRVDVKALGCDAYVASPHKWLLAPKGTGFLFARREVQDRFWTTLDVGPADIDRLIETVASLRPA